MLREKQIIMADLVTWIFARRARVPTLQIVSDDRALNAIMMWLTTHDVHILELNGVISGVVVYNVDNSNRQLTLHLILVEKPATLADFTEAWLGFYPGFAVSGWRKKHERYITYPQAQVLKALKLFDKQHVAALCKN